MYRQKIQTALRTPMLKLNHMPIQSTPEKKPKSDIVPITAQELKQTKRQHLRHFPMEQAPLFNKAAHQLRLAVHEGNSGDPKTNAKLKCAIRKALNYGMPMHAITQVILECKQNLDKQNENSCNIKFSNNLNNINIANMYLLQLRYKRKVYLICTTHTNNMLSLKTKIMPILKKHSGAIAFVMDHFHNCALIEAMISYQVAIDFNDLDGSIARDAADCNANGIEVVDYETGAVNFKCDPMQMAEVCAAVKARGYTVLHTEYAFRAKRAVELTRLEYMEYDTFLQKIRKLADIANIYDNVEKTETKNAND